MKFSIKKYFQVLGAGIGAILLAFFVVMGIDVTGGAALMAQGDGVTSAVGDAGVINVLLMCTDEDGLRTDSMILASYDTVNNTVNMLSIPRDLRVFVGNRYQKINAAHAYYQNGQMGGPIAACEAVTRLAGVTINYYVDFSFAAVAKVIDELGPVNFTIPDVYGDGEGMVYDDPVQSLHINLPPGNYDLNGQQVVHLLRYRQNNRGMGYPGGDTDRIAVQQEFLRTLVDQKLNVSVIRDIPAIYTDIMSDIKTNLTVKDMIKYSKYLTNFTSAGLHTETIIADSTWVENSGVNEAMLIPNMKQLQLRIMEMFGTDGSNMWYADPANRNPSLSYGGYMTVGGYVRTSDIGALSNYKESQLTNDEICLLRGIVQTADVPAAASDTGY